MKLLIWEGDPTLLEIAKGMSEEELNASYGCIYIKTKGPFGVFTRRAYIKVGSGILGLQAWIEDEKIHAEFGGLKIFQNKGVISLIVKKGFAPRVIGQGGKNIKRLADILGLGFVRVIEASEREVIRVSLCEKIVEFTIFDAMRAFNSGKKPEPKPDRTTDERIRLTPSLVMETPSGEIIQEISYSQHTISWKEFVENNAEDKRKFSISTRWSLNATLSYQVAKGFNLTEKKKFLSEVYSKMREAGENSSTISSEECFVEKHLDLIA